MDFDKEDVFIKLHSLGGMHLQDCRRPFYKLLWMQKLYSCIIKLQCNESIPCKIPLSTDRVTLLLAICIYTSVIHLVDVFAFIW
jgi:hypothetical protein